VTQLALLFALGSIGLALSFVLARLEVRRGSIAPTVKRIEGAVERAALSLLRAAALRTLPLLLVVVATALAGCSVLLGKPGPSLSAGGRIAFMVVALLAGALSSLAHARVTVAFGVRACSAATTSAARGSSRSLRPLLRAAAGLAGVGEGLGLLGVALAFAALYAVRGGFAQPSGSLELAVEVVRLLPAFALGAAVAALAFSRAGGTLASAVLVGGSQSCEREAQLDSTDPRNPAKLAELLGEQVGGLLPRALIGYVAGVSATIAAALLAVAAAPPQGSGSPAPLTCFLLVLVVRAFGIVGSVSGVFAARADENEAPEQALLRGQLCAFAVAVFGLGAGLYWLRVEQFFGVFMAGVAGLAVAVVLTQLAWLPLRRGASATRETVEARALSDAAAVARGASAGLVCLLPALLLPPLALWLVQRLAPGAGAAAPSQAAVVAAFVAGLIATAPYSLAVAGFGVLCEGAQAAAALARLEGDAIRPGARLDDASSIGGGAAACHASLALAASLLLGLFALRAGSEPSAPGVELSAVCGAVVLVLSFAARSARSALLGARVVAEEVKKQLQGLPRRQGTVTVPVDYTPSYKACVDSALVSARQGSLLDSAWVVLVPFALALALLGEAAPRPILLAFASAAVICGLTFVLGSRATRAALREARRRARAAAPMGAASAGGLQNFGDVVGLGAAVSVEALMGVLALSVLSLATLLG
jgi:K(+)-stimulated pyrophosphate-energized sodium pump